MQEEEFRPPFLCGFGGDNPTELFEDCLRTGTMVKGPNAEEDKVKMLHTSEIRWFIAGILSEETLRWFSGGHRPKTAAVQVHEYLLFPGCDTLGVKFREDRFEVKAKVGVSQPLSLTMGIRGQRQQWIKWTLPTKGLSMFAQALHQSGPWVKVHKVRNRRVFSAETGNLREVFTDSSPARGCNVELTSIEVEADPPSWFTLAFEAYGPPEVTAEILEEGVGFFFKAQGRTSGISLTKSNSLSYPTWLMNLPMTGNAR